MKTPQAKDEETAFVPGKLHEKYLTPKILRRYSGLHPASFLLFGTPNFSGVSALSNPSAMDKTCWER